jgi:hypothetical protein
MKKPIYGLTFLIFLCGCFAIVDDRSETKKVKSFIISKEETLYIMQKADEKKPEEKHQINLFGRL